ncbi:hypothetical protein GJ631_02385 [Natronomonas sp. CBA1123]|uniref:hypothetical protein n=1 Tax=Natronomonas sp. CBA1123 TaxID=2668070 RepID=UPI0012EA60D6|nr:hypothetical protein [Natronomonas sp. CBA1123]MUV85458.1 hypothetical protein [Natronomonas sp. CBA1123]
MVTLLSGLVGGLLATIVMTMFMMALGDDSPPPTAQLWAKYVGDGPAEEYMMPGMALHIMYGIGAGVAFVLVVPALGFGLETLLTAVAFGAAYGIVLTVVGMILWMRVVLAMEPDPKMMGMFTVFHLVYGVVLGAVVGSGILG